MFCRFCYTFIDSRINEEHAEEKDYCHIGKGCQSEEIIADDIDNHWYREQENPDRAIFQKVIPSRGLAFSQFAVYFSEFEQAQGKRNYRYCKQFHNRGNNEAQPVVKCQCARKQNFCLV